MGSLQRAGLHMEEVSGGGWKEGRYRLTLDARKGDTVSG